MMNLSAAILVGRSMRMGRDKALLELDHQTFLGRLARELSVCDEVLVCAPPGREYAAYGLRVIPDAHQGIGPMEGLRTNYVEIAAGGFSAETLDNFNTPADYARIVR